MQAMGRQPAAQAAHQNLIEKQPAAASTLLPGSA